MKIAVAADHAGRELKSYVVEFLMLTADSVLDYGVPYDVTSSVDYPDYSEAVAIEVSEGRCDRGILICGTGIGMCVVANKFKNIRAAVVSDEFIARASRTHNDTNIMCLGARVVNYQRAVDFVKIWLSTDFDEGRHKSRLGKIREIERRLLK